MLAKATLHIVRTNLFGFRNKNVSRAQELTKRTEYLSMDVFKGVVIFLLGAGAGAVTTAANYSGQIRELRRLLHLEAAHSLRAERKADTDSEEKRKSA
jgi:hypothetical protein